MWKWTESEAPPHARVPLPGRLHVAAEGARHIRVEIRAVREAQIHAEARFAPRVPDILAVAVLPSFIAEPRVRAPREVVQERELPVHAPRAEASYHKVIRKKAASMAAFYCENFEKIHCTLCYITTCIDISSEDMHHIF